MRPFNEYHLANFHVALVPRYIAVTFLTFLLCDFLIQSRGYSLPLVITLMVLLGLLSKRRILRLPENGPFATLSGLYGKYFLPLPCEYRIWWNYNFKGGYMLFGDGLKTTATANDLNVYLEMMGQDGKSLIFHELIKYGTRFPNEARYSLEKPPKGTKIYLVHRLDKLLSFLDHELEKSETK